MKPLVIYHDCCTDGFGAAFAAWLILGNEAEYLPMAYNDTTTQLEYTGRDLYILDFSFPREVMEHMFANAKNIVWLDHHKTAFEMWGVPVGRHEQNYGHIILDNDKSGAYLAWEYFHPDIEVPRLIKHIDDRDRWQWKMEGTAELHASLNSNPFSFDAWNIYLTPGYEDSAYSYAYREGSAILRAEKQQIARMCKQARSCYIADESESELRYGTGFNGLAVNATIHISEVGHELATTSGTFGLIWYVDANNRVKCSLRSNGDYDVSAIARVFGGGGHRNAAGFETEIETLMEWLKSTNK